MAGSSVQYGSFVCRNFHGDSPLEHRSGFALEANEMGVVLGLGELRENSEGQPRTFVCIDEFGKGTEDKHATALCAASLKHLDQVLIHAVLCYAAFLLRACVGFLSSTGHMGSYKQARSTIL
jgi:DNA mismatch repair ATPase MutS